MTENLVVVCTDFGPVKLSPKVVSFLDGMDPRWQEIASKPGKFRSKRNALIRARVKAIESAAQVLAAVEYSAGNVLVAI